MKLTPPTKTVFYVSVLLLVLAVIIKFVPSLQFFGGLEFWTAIVGGALLAAGNYFKGF